MTTTMIQFIYYAEANLVGVILVGLLILHDLRSVDRQEKRVRFDIVLLFFALYFISDSVWEGVLAGVFEETRAVVVWCTFANYVLLSSVTLSWLRYVLAVEQAPSRNRPLVRVAVLLPFLIFTTLLIAIYWADPDMFLSTDLEQQLALYAFRAAPPVIYIITVLAYTMNRVKAETVLAYRAQHYYIGFIPLIMVLCGVIQIIFLPHIPLFCQSVAILMIWFYIKSLDARISTDGLTGLNNRGQILRYLSVKSNLYLNDRLTYLVMFDINHFKDINDTYGHAEGDHALVLIADALSSAVKAREVPGCLGRYGGDEFCFIAHPVHKEEMELLLEDIRSRIEAAAEANDLPYRLTVGSGCDQLLPPPDTIQKCMQRADKKLYLDKEYRKLHEAAEDADLSDR